MRDCGDQRSGDNADRWSRWRDCRGCRGGGDAIRHDPQHGDRADDQQRDHARGGGGVLQHEQSPLEDAEGGRRAGQARTGAWRDAQANQQAPVFVRAMAIARDHCGVASGFPCECVLTCGEVRERVEKEKVLRHRRQQTPPQVTALQVDQFMGQRHVQFIGVHGPCVIVRQQQDGIPRANQLG